MQYYTDGANDLIRIDAPDNVTGPALTEAPAARYNGAELGWLDSEQYSLPVTVLFSGDYYPVDEPTAQQIMGQIDAE